MRTSAEVLKIKELVKGVCTPCLLHGDDVIIDPILLMKLITEIERLNSSQPFGFVKVPKLGKTEFTESHATLYRWVRLNEKLKNNSDEIFPLFK